MADEHDKWLNRDAADRLLRGEPPAVPGDAARQADRMAAALHALADVPARPDGELPGEEAALKAFRDARTVTAANTAVNGAAAGTTHALRPVRPKRRTAGSGQRWGRPARFGVVAAFAACMVGGVAVAAGTGVLPSPFRGSDDPAPAASVSAAASPDRPLASASAGVEEDGHAVPSPTRSPSATGRDTGSPSHSQDIPREGRTSKDEGPKATVPGGADARAEARRLVDTCRKYRGGELGSEDVQRLESSAKSLGQSPRSLGRFCDRVLARESAPTTSADRTASHHEGDSGSSDDGGGSYGQSGGGKGKGADDDEESDAVGSASADGSLPSASVSISPSPTPDVGASPDADPSVSTSTSPTPTP